MNPLYPQGKLVRDGIPAILRQRGEQAVFYVAEGEEVTERLRTKLVEEVLEFLAADTFRAMCQELGDVFDVLDELLSRFGVSPDAFDAMRTQKVAAYGAFSGGHVMVLSENPESTSESSS